MRFPRSSFTALAVAFLTLSSLAAAAQTAPRYALVIGNSGYTSMPRLRNPSNDAHDVAEVLNRLGFSVTPLYDCTRKQMNQAIMAFRESLASDRASEGFFYFAGHGVQARGVNYLIPVGADIRTEADLDDEAVSLQRVLGSIEEARNRVNIVILDACRDNPLPAASRGAARGLAVVASAPPESVVLFSTAQNQTASDGDGRNSPFASALVKYLPEPGDISRTIKLITAEVKRATGSAQTPFQYTSLDLDYRLNRGAESPTPTPAPATTLTVTRSYGSLVVSAVSGGTLYLEGTAMGDLPPGAEAHLDNVETGDRVLELRYATGEKETKTVAVQKGITAAVSFTWKASSVGGSELKIAILAPLSGPVPAFGVSTRNGALLAISEWNSKGGVLGMKIIPIVEDSQCTADPAVKAARKVITQDKVHYIIGEVCSSASIPVSDIANASKVIQISTTSTSSLVTVDSRGNTKAYIFRACFIDPFQGKVGAVFARSSLKANKAFILYDSANEYVSGLARAFEAAFKNQGGSIVGKEAYNGKDTDFSTILAKVKYAAPDIVYLPDYYTIVNLATRQARAMGVTAPFLGGDGWDSSDLDTKAADGAYFTNHFSSDDRRSQVRDFLRVYGAAYSTPTAPDAISALAYDATNLLLAAIMNAGADSTDKVKAALETISYDGVTGRIAFDGQHNPVKGAVIMKVTGGKVVFDLFVTP
jgi:branched-chain amino acid transport system substrate-binding protein